MWLINLYILISIHQFFQISDGKVTDKEYALMPPVFHLDDYDNCMLYGDEALYCTFKYEVYPENPGNTTKIWQIIEEVSSNEQNYRHDHLRHGICVPKSCPFIPKGLSPGDPKIRPGLKECYDKKFKEMGLKGIITQLHCETTESPYPIDSLDVITAVFLICYIIFVFLASYYEGLARYQSKEYYEKVTGTTFGKIISAFSLPKNWYRLKHIDHDNPDVQKLRSIQGVRFYNMICVFLSHTVFVAIVFPNLNPKFVETMTEKFLNVFLANGGYAVQTFFMISTWLLTNHIFQTFEGKKKMTWSYLFLIFVHRYLRLIPTMAVVILIQCTWMVHYSRGPLWDFLVGAEYRRCRKNWWTNLLYVNTIVNKEEMCLVQTWYMGVDTQYFVVSLIIIWFMWNYKNKIPWILGSILLTNALIYFLIIYINDYEFIVRPTPELEYDFTILTKEEWHTVLASFTANMPGLVAGLTFGYIYYKYKDSKFLTSKPRLALWWFIVYGGALGIIIVPGLIMFDPNYEHNVLFAAISGSISRIVFIYSIGVGILGMTQGEGWMMKWVCEWPPTYILGRLTYSAYLIHVLLMRLDRGVARSPIYISDFTMTYQLIGDLAVGYTGALFLTLFVEMPVSELQKCLIPQKEKSSTTKAVNGLEKDKLN